MSLCGLLRSAVTLDLNMAGLVCLTCGPWSLHLLVRKRHWSWGYTKGWWDGPMPEYGLGPLFKLVGWHPDVWCYVCNDDYCEKRDLHG